MARSLRVVAYAVNGGGAGHLQRLTAIARWLRRYAAACGTACEVYFLTSSEADSFLFHEGLASFKLPSKTTVASSGIDKLAYVALAKQWVWHSLGLLRPDLLLVDTFPNGSFGELVSALDLVQRRVFVYRPVKDGYARRADFQAMLPLYDLVLVPEARESARVVVPEKAEERLLFTGPVLTRERVELRSREDARERFGIPEGRLAVLVSAGGGGDPAAEADLLLASRLLLARPDLHVVVAAGPLYRGARPSGERVVWVSEPALAEWLPGFDLAVAAAGYNTVLELMHAGVPAVFLPQEKVADEQDRRAAAAVAAGAALVAGPAPSREGLDEAIGRLLDGETRRRAAAAARALVPRNHARDAAAAILELVLPEHEVAAAHAAVDDELLAASRALGVPLEGFFDLIRTLEGAVPAGAGRTSARGDRRARAASGAARGMVAKAVELGVPPALAPRLLGPLQKRLLRGSLAERGEAAERIVRALSPFGEWGTALQLLRALDPPKDATAAEVAAEVEAIAARWPTERGSLAQAVAALAAEEGDGARSRPVAGGRG